jgi:hypothetical protein
MSQNNRSGFEFFLKFLILPGLLMALLFSIIMMFVSADDIRKLHSLTLIVDQMNKDYDVELIRRDVRFIDVKCWSSSSMGTTVYKLDITYKFADFDSRTIRISSPGACHGGSTLIEIARAYDNHVPKNSYTLYGNLPYDYDAVKPIIDTVLAEKRTI